MAAAEALIPGLLTIAREFPLIGPFAGVALQFYRGFKNSRDNKTHFAKLKEQIDLGIGWVREIAPRLKSIDSVLVEAALKKVVSAVHHAASLVEALNHRLDDGSK
jgi:hypothetical protein